MEMESDDRIHRRAEGNAMKFKRLLAQGVMACLLFGSAGGAGSAWAQLADTVARIKPSIVLIGTYRATDSPRFHFLGTGFVVGSGLRVITNAHVAVAAQVNALADSERALVVQVPSGAGVWTMHPARVLEKNETHDLALLHMDGPAAPAMAITSSQKVREGEDLAFTGFPIGGLLGFSPVTHRATVSSITTMALPSPTGQRLSGRAIRSLRDAKIQVFQLDATAYPGNSGGPLFDAGSGEVLGVINMVLVKSTRESALTQPSGITYAIPSQYVLELLERNP